MPSFRRAQAASQPPLWLAAVAAIPGSLVVMYTLYTAVRVAFRPTGFDLWAVGGVLLRGMGWLAVVAILFTMLATFVARSWVDDVERCCLEHLRSLQ